MIVFSCKHCGECMEAPESLGGEPLDCPKCSHSTVVPLRGAETGDVGPKMPDRISHDPSSKIQFNCLTCHASITTSHDKAGQKGKCPHCKEIVVVPSRTDVALTSAPNIQNHENQECMVCGRMFVRTQADQVVCNECQTETQVSSPGTQRGRVWVDDGDAPKPYSIAGIVVAALIIFGTLAPLFNGGPETMRINGQQVQMDPNWHEGQALQITMGLLAGLALMARSFLPRLTGDRALLVFMGASFLGMFIVMFATRGASMTGTFLLTGLLMLYYGFRTRASRFERWRLESRALVLELRRRGHPASICSACNGVGWVGRRHARRCSNCKGEAYSKTTVQYVS